MGADQSARDLNRHNAVTQLDIGRELEAVGDTEAALDRYRQAAQIDPAYAPVYLLIGHALGQMGDWEAVVENYETAIRHIPGYADAYNNLGVALSEIGCDQDAIAAHAKAVDINPLHANAWFNLGKLSAKNEDADAAFLLLQKTLAIQPDHAYALHELGSLQEKSGLLHEAALSYAGSMRLDPTRTIRENLAALLTLLGDSRGLDQLRQLVREQPENAEAHWNLGIGLLLHERYEEGWAEYEWRMEIPRFQAHHHRYPQPRWQGEPLDGRTILIYGEQGHGDTLQFMRYVPQIAARGGRVVLEVLPLLRPLLEGFPGIAACLAPTDPKPEFSLQAPLMSLPHLLRCSDIPAPVAPTPVAPGLPKHAAAGSSSSRKLRVGLAWAGNPNQKRDHLRSIPLEQWKPLGAVEETEFVSLQMGPSRFSAENSSATNSGEAFPFVQDCRETPDFAQLAEVVATLDLVISIDSAVAHLAGTMGKTLWILLPNAVDWRWGLRGSSTPWYPGAKLFRQTTPRDWTTIMAAVAEELRGLATRFTRERS